MRLDLAGLKQMHPLLPATTAAEYEHRAALGLERRSHKPGVRMAARIEDESAAATLHWTSAARAAEQLDRQRITEDAAEAVTLALVHEGRGWVVRRRLQRGESADWLLLDAAQQLIALEISGLDRGDPARRLREKLKQAELSRIAPQRAACVVELATPQALLERTET